MNIYLLIGSVLIVIGTGLSLIGNYQNANEMQRYQAKSENYIEDQQSLDVPNIDVLDVKGEGRVLKLRIKNTGRRLAQNVQFNYSKNCTPIELSMNPSPDAKEVPNNTEYIFNLDIFRIIDLLSTTPEQNKIDRPEFVQIVEKFTNGTGVFQVRFNISYEYNGEKYITPNYLINVAKNEIFGIMKDE